MDWLSFVTFPEFISAVSSVTALLFSWKALRATRVNWLQSNRPIVVAYVTEQHAGKEAATFKLLLANTGNRPAVRVRLFATEGALRGLVDPNVSKQRVKLIKQIFLSESTVPILLNGEQLETSFGATTQSSDEPWLCYGGEATIQITYNDLEGCSYTSRLPLRIYARDGFGGGVWSNPEP